jgi:hypothetical protein
VALALIHGFEGSKFLGYTVFFKVDEYTIYLLLIAMVPFLFKFLKSIKYGDLEANFMSLTLEDKLFTFLEGIAIHERWTYYRPRSGEKSLGEAFGMIAQKAQENDPKKFHEMLKAQLESKTPNLVWFASENIGFFRILNLKHDLQNYLQGLSANEQWTHHHLNCLWSYSRFENYKSLQDLYLSSNRRHVVDWVTEAYDQMAYHHPSERDIVLEKLNEKKRQIEALDSKDFYLEKVLLPKIENVITNVEKINT